MNKISVSVLDHTNYGAAMASLACDITQHNIMGPDDLKKRYNRFKLKPLAGAIKFCSSAKHSTPLELNNYVIAIVGASRRFLAQIRTYRVGITFVSASLQYQNVSDTATYVIPYEIIKAGPMVIEQYNHINKLAALNYRLMVNSGYEFNHDTAGYIQTQALRNTVLISGNAQTLKHIIQQRSCRRNTDETRYVALKMWQELLKTDNGDLLFFDAGPACAHNEYCDQGKMSCGRCYPKCKEYTESDVSCILREDWPLLYKEE